MRKDDRGWKRPKFNAHMKLLEAKNHIYVYVCSM